MAPISFARGVPASELLPVAELADCARAVFERDGARALNYGPVGGYPPLREWLAERHGVGTESVLVMNGSLQGLDLLMTRFAAERRVLVEAPTYDRALAIARRQRIGVTAIRHDDEGLDLGALEHELARDRSPAFLYLLPTFQNPTGRTLSLERRRRVLELADAHDLIVLEDDPYGVVRFEGKPLPTLHELAPPGRVIYSSSFSKIVAPGLRVGYLIVPEQLGRELEAAAVSTYLAPVLATQAIVFELIDRGGLGPNVERVCSGLRARRDAMIEALGRELPAASWNRPEGGYFLWLELPEGVDVSVARSAAEGSGVTFVPGADFFDGAGQGSSSARLAFSFASPEEIAEGVARLARACSAAALV